MKTIPKLREIKNEASCCSETQIYLLKHSHQVYPSLLIKIGIL